MRTALAVSDLTRAEANLVDSLPGVEEKVTMSHAWLAETAVEPGGQAGGGGDLASYGLASKGEVYYDATEDDVTYKLYLTAGGASLYYDSATDTISVARTVSRADLDQKFLADVDEIRSAVDSWGDKYGTSPSFDTNRGSGPYVLTTGVGDEVERPPVTVDITSAWEMDAGAWTFSEGKLTDATWLNSTSDPDQIIRLRDGQAAYTVRIPLNAS